MNKTFTWLLTGLIGIAVVGCATAPAPYKQPDPAPVQAPAPQPVAVPEAPPAAATPACGCGPRTLAQ